MVRSVTTGQSDVGIASESVSVGSRLVFFPVFEEQFDMVVKKEIFFDKNVQAFVEFIRSELFRNLLKVMKGYNDRETGKVMYPIG